MANKESVFDGDFGRDLIRLRISDFALDEIVTPTDGSTEVRVSVRLTILSAAAFTRRRCFET